MNGPLFVAMDVVDAVSRRRAIPTSVCDVDAAQQVATRLKTMTPRVSLACLKLESRAREPGLVLGSVTKSSDTRQPAHDLVPSGAGLGHHPHQYILGVHSHYRVQA
jgi:hypothetical protein